MVRRKSDTVPAADADPLAPYNAKRDFAKTAEPAGKRAHSDTGNRFIVQKHDATRLHWDFRLEADGVLKSWAVTRGPSPNPDDKRLAVHTEDHPLAYAEFEGVIPEGEYGGGTVMLWDRGTWAPVEGKSAKDIDAKGPKGGHIHFTLDGERMKGEWILFRIRGRPGEKRENWLLRKVADAHVGPSDALVDRCLTSVLTGRTMAEIAVDKAGVHPLAGKDGDDFTEEMARAAGHNRKVAAPKSRAKRKAGGKLPGFRPVQLATLVDEVPSGNGWMHEIKFDGYRLLVAAAGGEVRVFTRNGLDWTDKFAGLAAAFAAHDLPPCLVDGEVTAPGVDGNPSFSALQAVLKRGHGAQGQGQHLDFHAFDLLELDGQDLTGFGNIERKERLEALLGDAPPPIHVADHVIGAGEPLFNAMCEAGQEGIIAKRIDAPYRGARSKSWLKVKCVRREEFVIVGWTRSDTKLRPFASLLLAQTVDGKLEYNLKYRGKVGTGFDEELLADLAARFEKLAREKAPLDVPRAEARGAQWIEPKLVADIAFTEVTADGRLRHPSFVGLREDKTAAEARPEPATPVPPPAASSVRISNRDRVIFPESGQTKGQLADYYAAIAGPMLVHTARRPVSLVRCPQGRAKKCFFQKHDSGAFGPSVHQVPIREKDGHAEEYIYVEDAEGLLTCVQMGTIEFHGWGSHVADVEAPDRMVFDLDPDEGLGFDVVKRAAFDLRDHLSDLGLVSFALLSGGKGVHICVPLDAGHDWDTHKDFSHRFALAMSAAEPDRFIANMSKAKRKGLIFIDYLRNQRGGTAVMPYSARSRANAPVAAPVTWDELADIDTAARWTIADAEELLDRAASKALAGWGFASQSLPAF